MASYTSHYNLKKPAGDEKVQITDINANMDTLDSTIYSVATSANSTSAYTVLDSVSTESAFFSSLTTQLAAMNTNSEKIFRIAATATNGFLSNGATYLCLLQKGGSNTYASALITSLGTADKLYVAGKGDTTWTISEFPHSDRVPGVRGTLASGTNLNTLTKAYDAAWLNSSYTYTNSPASGMTGVIFTFAPSYTSNAFCTQVVVTADCIYVRKQFESSGSGWGAWQIIAPNGCGWLENGTNIDNLTKPGVYGISSSKTYTGTLPTGVNAGILEVIAPAAYETYVFQRLSLSTTLYQRYRANSSGTTWSAWYKFTGTQA